jgi:hypothetical protein
MKARLRKYKITGRDFALMYMRQGGKCHFCKISFAERLAAIDHCHETGRVRGLLCYKCNGRLGHVEAWFNENPNLSALLDYLQWWVGQTDEAGVSTGP